MLTCSQLKTSRGSLTNARVATFNGIELLYSYQTLVGARILGVPDGPTHFIRRDGQAASMTTGRQINTWLMQTGRTKNDATVKTVSADELEKIATDYLGR